MFLTRIGYGIIYFLDLIYEIIKSTIDVVFNKIMRRNIDPVVIDVETVLERPVSQTILAETNGDVLLNTDNLRIPQNLAHQDEILSRRLEQKYTVKRRHG